MDNFGLDKYLQNDSQNSEVDDQFIIMDDTCEIMEEMHKFEQEELKMSQGTPMVISQDHDYTSKTEKDSSSSMESSIKLKQPDENVHEIDDNSIVEKIDRNLKQLNDLLNAPDPKEQKGKKRKKNQEQTSMITSVALQLANNFQQPIVVPVNDTATNISNPISKNLESSTKTANSCIINLDDNDEPKSKNRMLIDLFEENYQVSIKMRWKGKIQKFPLRQHQRFEDLIVKLAEEENVDPRQIIITMNDAKIIEFEDTPESIGNTVSTILAGRIVDLDLIDIEHQNKKVRRDKNLVKIRAQAQTLKKPIEVMVNKTHKFSTIKYKIADVLKWDGAKFKLKFDGEFINLDKTPIDYEIDTDEIIDLIPIND